MNDFPDFDLYTLHLIRLVAKHRGFTAASQEAGISQSALTRQVQGVETRIGVKLFERTTRKVSLTEAGAILLRETEPLPNILKGALRRVREECLEAPKVIRVGLSTALAQAHIPGIFHRQRIANPDSTLIVSQGGEVEISEGVRSARLDLGIVVAAGEIDEGVVVTHEMDDPFCAVVPTEVEVPETLKEFRSWAKSQDWLLPPAGSPSRELIDLWARKARFSIQAAMELESFDLMNQFTALGMGVAIVPRRSLSSLARKHQVKKVSLPVALTRKLVVISPRYGKIPEHVSAFVEEILFS